ncbi:thiamine monophosphate synthase [Eubacterium sp. CAG:248]|nr:thiamine monophosphate synthase [Eubacterium sp. CAG:248]
MLNDVIAVTNRKLSQRPFLEQIKRVCQLRPEAIILREKDLSETEYAKLAEEVYNITTSYDVRLIIHTYINVARELGINTVHMSLHNMREYRKEFIDNVNKTNNIKTGCSIHSVEEAVEARNMGVSYITAGHVYVTDCKKGLAPRGLDFLKNVCDSVDIPVYAIGGINIDDGRREEVKKYGAAGSCIMSGMMKV